LDRPLHLLGEDHLRLDDIVLARPDGAMIRAVGIDGPSSRRAVTPIPAGQNVAAADLVSSSGSRRKAGDVVNHYDVLGVEPTAGPEAIKHAWRVKVLLLHPDMHRGSPDEVQAEAMKETLRVNTAWQTLGDPEERRRYDLQLLGQRAARRRGTGDGHAAPSDADESAFSALVTCAICKTTQRVPGTAGRFDCVNCKMAWQIAKCEECDKIAYVRERKTSWTCATCGHHQSSTWGGGTRYIFCPRCKSGTLAVAGVDRYECGGCGLHHLRCTCGHYASFPTAPWWSWVCPKCSRVNRRSSSRSLDLANSLFVLMAVCLVIVGLILLAGLAP
jgi:DnaJ domain